MIQPRIPETGKGFGKTLVKTLADHLTDFLAVTAIILVGMLCSCEPIGDRVAGTSTEAGNAGGKLSLATGQPASGVSVALVARSYVPDTLSHGSADVPGSYYRTRTGPDGRFALDGLNYQNPIVGMEIIYEYNDNGLLIRKTEQNAGNRLDSKRTILFDYEYWNKNAGPILYTAHFRGTKMMIETPAANRLRKETPTP